MVFRAGRFHKSLSEGVTTNFIRPGRGIRVLLRCDAAEFPEHSERRERLVRIGSKADIVIGLSGVRSYPKSGLSRRHWNIRVGP